MNASRKRASGLLLLAAITMSSLMVSMLSLSSTSAQPVIALTVATDKMHYDIREQVVIAGEAIQAGSPATDCLVSIEARNPRDDALLYRTILIGDQTEMLPIEIIDVYLKSVDGNLTETALVDDMIQLWASIRNMMVTSVDIIITSTVLDGNSIPLFSGWHMASVQAMSTRTFSWSVYIPEWAYSGKAQAFINVYNDFPKNGGVPQSLETPHTFYITRNPELKYPYSVLPATSYSEPGLYETTFRLSPDRYSSPGDYSVYASLVADSIYRTFNSTSYNLASVPSPPQASFTYLPLQVLANMTVTFDGSSSSAEGYNDIIIRYEWDINDPNDPQHIVNSGNFTNPPDPTVLHAFVDGGTYTVELNVTDNEGLWSTTSKPITVLPEYGPTANFTWTPSNPFINGTITFDAVSSEPGWSAQIADYAPITQYKWNFSDGVVLTTNDSTILHEYSEPGNFTVTLTVTDSVGRKDSESKTVEVENRTRRIYDVAEPYGKIDIRDVSKVAKAYGTQPGDPNWDPEADITGPTGEPDGKVDIRDISMVASHYGEEYEY